ncbi:MAG: VWA domain-containing protein [Chloroflexota bacterium]
MKNKWILHLLLALFILQTSVFTAIPANAQANIRLNIDAVNNSLFPQIELNLSVSDTQGFPVKGLTEGNFSVTEDGQPVSGVVVIPAQNIQQPLAFVLVIDTSGSMGSSSTPTPLQNAIQAAKAFIDTLSPQDQVALIAFADQVTLVQDLTADKTIVHNALDTLKPSGNTALYDALVEAVDTLKNRSERRVIVLLTDGVDSGVGQFTFDDAVNEAARWAVPVYPIGFGSVDKSELEKLASLTGGAAQIQPNSSTLQAAFQVVLGILREQYVLRYTSSLPADGKEHELVVKLDYQGWHVEQSRKFVAQPSELKITLPGFSEGQVIGGLVRFAPEIVSPGPMAELNILIDGQVLTNVLATPFEYAWDSTTVTPGEHEFTFNAKDIAGNTGQATIHLNIQPPIIVQIEKPAQGETLSGKTVLTANVTALSKVASVQFLIDSKPLQTLDSPPYEVEWNLSSVPSGPHTIEVIATDVNGFSARSSLDIKVALQKGSGMLWLALLVILAAVALILPLSLRRRRASVIKASGAASSLGSGTVLVELEGMNPQRTWPLSAGEIQLGRKRDENDIHLKGLSASRRHAVIRFQEGRHTIFSLNPGNPVYVNDSPVQQQALGAGDVLRMGESIFRYEQR